MESSHREVEQESIRWLKDNRKSESLPAGGMIAGQKRSRIRYCFSSELLIRKNCFFVIRPKKIIILLCLSGLFISLLSFFMLSWKKELNNFYFTD
jgi:hypothetical protein